MLYKEQQYLVNVLDYKEDIIKFIVSFLPFFIYSLSYTTLFFSSFILTLQYNKTVQECVFKMLFTALFHIISLDTKYKYCPDYYVLAMLELKKRYMNNNVYRKLTSSPCIVEEQIINEQEIDEYEDEHEVYT